MCQDAKLRGLTVEVLFHEMFILFLFFPLRKALQLVSGGRFYPGVVFWWQQRQR